MMPTLASLVVTEIVIITTASAISDDNAGIMPIPGYQWIQTAMTAYEIMDCMKSWTVDYMAYRLHHPA